jgi:hypothetical protein
LSLLLFALMLGQVFPQSQDLGECDELVPSGSVVLVQIPGHGISQIILPFQTAEKVFLINKQDRYRPVSRLL